MANSKSMTTLLLKYSAMLLIIIITYSTLLNACIVVKQDSYLAAYFDKTKLLKETKSPKIVFVGGSNIAFGLDSSRVGKVFGFPVINMGLHAGLGLKLMLDQVKPYLNRNDIVVVIPEYSHFVGDLFYGDKDLFELAKLTHNWTPLLDMPLISIVNNALKLNRYIYEYNRNTSYGITNGSIYARNSFDRYGDVTAHLFLPNEKYSRNYEQMPDSINKTAVRYLYNFITNNAEHGITTLMLYPCLEMSYYQRQATTINKIASTLNKNGIKPLSVPLDFLYSDDLFFNTNYHLNKQGRQLRTEKVIDILRAAL